MFDRKHRPIAIEIKYSLAPKPEKGFWIAFSDLKCRTGFVVYPGDESYPAGEDVHILPVKNLMRIVEEISK